MNVFIGLFFCVFVLLGVAAWICGIVAEYRLMSYLKKHHHERWRYLNSVIGNWGAEWGHNGFRLIPYLFSQEDNNDSRVVMLKRKVRLSMLYSVGAMVAVLVIPWLAAGLKLL